MPRSIKEYITAAKAGKLDHTALFALALFEIDAILDEGDGTPGEVMDNAFTVLQDVISIAHEVIDASANAKRLLGLID